MKNSKKIFILLGIVIAILLIAVIAYKHRDRKSNELDLPQLEEMSKNELEKNEMNVETYKKEEITNMEKTSLTNRVEKLDPVDQIGKNFKTSDLTNDELLRIGYSLFGPAKNFGFENITFENLNRTYINGYLGREDAQAKDIICACGNVIATYNSSNDTYTWDDEFHYLEHKSDAYNEIKDMYKIEDKYIVEVYKIFPDLLRNSSTTQYNFYATYNDAENQENALFTVTNEDEFANEVEKLEDNQKRLYILTFEKVKGSFKLVDYKIK